MTLNGNVSFWYDEIGLPAARPPLEGPTSVDVCIVGGGFTGLWTAIALTEVGVVREMARCLREIGEGRVPE